MRPGCSRRRLAVSHNPGGQASDLSALVRCPRAWVWASWQRPRGCVVVSRGNAMQASASCAPAAAQHHTPVAIAHIHTSLWPRPLRTR